MLVSFVIPTYNEEETIAEVVREIRKLKGFRKEIIVVDGNSTDRTAKIAAKLGVRLFREKAKTGKGSAVKKGFAAAKGDIILVQDADMEYHPNEIPRLARPIIDGKADIVYGSRFLGTRKGMSILHNFGNRFLSLSTSILLGKRVTDMTTGHKLFRREVVRSIKLSSNGFQIDPELTVKAIGGGWRFLEIPITYYKRKTGLAKVTVVDGINIFLALLKFRFSK